jgi:hypothetical protein
MTSEAQKAADARYKAANTKQIKFVLNKNTEPDLIAHLESIDNVQGYIKSLIRADMQSKTRQE